MLLKPKKFQVVFYSLVLGLSALLNSCGNSQQLEKFLSADPSLQSQTDKKATNNSSNAIAAEKQEIPLTKLPEVNSTTNSESQSDGKIKTDSLVADAESEKSFADLPENLPFYPQATLEVIAPESTPEEGVSKWRSQDSVDTIVSYYLSKWQNPDWQVIQPFQTDAENQATAVVSQDNLEYTILLTPIEPVGQGNQSETELTVSYQAADSLNAANGENTEAQVATNTDNLERNSNNTSSNNFSEETESPESDQSQSNSFSDLAETPEQLRQYVADLADLGILTPKTKDLSTNSRQFKPNEIITRREYAKWLVTANNKYYADSPGNKISLASKSTNAAFKDIGANDPDFAEIQGLAEAGLIPSTLTNSSSNLSFKPDAPLTREDLLTWKIPLDIRKGLPNADATAIKEAWGFQDTNTINPLALQALFADYQNSDRSNVKRIFGYTTLFQPKKAVTRAEAAASLWSFGYQGEGMTAKETLSEKTESVSP
jgi:hypothetical protein